MQSADSRRRINNILSSLEFFSGQHVLNMEELMLAAYSHYINFASNQPDMLAADAQDTVQSRTVHSAEGADVYSRILPPAGSMLLQNMNLLNLDTKAVSEEGTPPNSIRIQETLPVHGFLQSLNQIWHTALGDFSDALVGSRKQTEELPDAVQANAEMSNEGEAVAPWPASSEHEPPSNQADESKLKLTYSQVVRNLAQSHPLNRRSSPEADVLAPQSYVESRLPKPTKSNRSINKAAGKEFTSRSRSLAGATKSRQCSLGKPTAAVQQKCADRQRYVDKPKQRAVATASSVGRTAAKTDVSQVKQTLVGHQVQSVENVRKTALKKRGDNNKRVALLCAVATKETTESVSTTAISRKKTPMREAEKQDQCASQCVIRQSAKKKKKARKAKRRRRNNEKRRRERHRGLKQCSCLVKHFSLMLFNNGMSAVNSLTGLLTLCMNGICNFFNLR